MRVLLVFSIFFFLVCSPTSFGGFLSKEDVARIELSVDEAIEQAQSVESGRLSLISPELVGGNLSLAASPTGALSYPKHGNQTSAREIGLQHGAASLQESSHGPSFQEIVINKTMTKHTFRSKRIYLDSSMWDLFTGLTWRLLQSSGGMIGLHYYGVPGMMVGMLAPLPLVFLWYNHEDRLLNNRRELVDKEVIRVIQKRLKRRFKEGTKALTCRNLLTPSQ